MKSIIKPVFWIFLVMVAGLLNSCEKALIKEEKQDPVAVFNYLWNIMDTKYAMFSYKNTDWKAIYNTYRPMVSGNTTAEELFTICSTMLDQLKDGHVSLISDKQAYAYHGYYSSYTSNFSWDQLRQQYLSTASRSGILTYQLNEGTGYVYIPSFGQSLDAESIEFAFKALEKATVLIIDVRDNSGGGSLCVDQIVGKFLQKRTLLKYDIYKKGTAHDDFYPPEAKYLSPTGTAFSQKPIVVLTNRKCFSSCNDFVLYLSELPQVTVIGDQTGGGGGTPFMYELPNGWKLRYSASMATSANGINIESGILPDKLISNSMEDERKGRDAIFEYALHFLSGSK